MNRRLTIIAILAAAIAAISAIPAAAERSCGREVVQHQPVGRATDSEQTPWSGTARNVREIFMFELPMLRQHLTDMELRIRHPSQTRRG